MAAKSAMKTAKKSGGTRRKKPGIAVFRAILNDQPANTIAPRTFASAPESETAIAAPAAEVAAAATRTFVAVVSHDGPWELRSLTVNGFQILDKTKPLTELRVDVPIPSVFGGPLQINWSILAGHLIPGAATFAQEAGRQPVKLGEKAPLKKGESWTPLTAAVFP